MNSYSQIGQDLWVLSFYDTSSPKTFVEIGAADGIEISNTYILEKDYNWLGLCVEPSRQYENLKNNRNCKLDNRLVYGVDNLELEFLEDYKNGNHNWFSGIAKDISSHEVSGILSMKKTISLDSLLKDHDFKRKIEYISIDTEGSEVEILKSFNFNDWEIDLLTVEHNYDEQKRNQIFKILTLNGFIRENLVETMQDDWFYHKNMTSLRRSYQLNNINCFNKKRISAAYNKIFHLESVIQDQTKLLDNLTELN